MQKIVPCLWFNGQAEAAVSFYTSVFKQSAILTKTYYGDAGPGAKGSVMTIKFQINGERFLALNAGPEFTFTEAISMMVNCETQTEIDEYWEKLSEGGQKVECGWLKDKFGLSWQVVPTSLERMMQDPDTAKRDRVMKALLQMKKLDMDALRQAFEAAPVGASGRRPV